MQALEGIRVLDLSRAMAGPYCTMMLGDLGADVIKVERPGSGDESRGYGPPFVGQPYGPYEGQSTYFFAANRSKRSLTLNLKSEPGLEIMHRLVAASDVLVENFRTGALDRMGLGYRAVHGINPGLVYCSVSGYGRTGPYAELPGYDVIIQAEGGMMGITGPVEGPPSRVGVPIVDICTGMFAATAILAALRARQSTGEGQLVDISLLDTQAALLTNVASSYLVEGKDPERLGNAHPNISPYEVFKARDRWFVVGAANERQWGILCDMIGRPEMKDEPRFSTNSDRVANRTELADILNQAFASRDASDWIEEMRKAGLPCGPINTVPAVFDHPQAQAREMILETQHPSVGALRLAGFPYKLSQTPADVHRPPPLLGEHNEEVLVDLLGYSKDQVASFQERGAI
ncbi:MAG: CoA transferase [Anaerolineales bacterium]|nr:CoA transferase [Anaerolineales bacterium]